MYKKHVDPTKIVDMTHIQCWRHQHPLHIIFNMHGNLPRLVGISLTVVITGITLIFISFCMAPLYLSDLVHAVNVIIIHHHGIEIQL